MNLDFGTLQVERLIIHEIPKRIAAQSGTLKVSSKECPLEQADKNFFAERIKESLSKSQYEAKFLPETQSPVPKHIHRILLVLENGENNFVSISQSIAVHLYSCQTGINPPGALVIAKVKVMGKPSLAILKLEKEEGIQYEPEESIDGSVLYNIKQISNLMMTGAKVFKAGLFVLDSGEMHSIKGYISDKQRGIKSNIAIAKFFLNDFLGCELIDSPELITKAFYKISQEFINNQITDVEVKTKYELALLAMIQNNNNVIEPENFAELHLELDDRQNFINHLQNNDVPTSSFEKDTSAIENNIKTVNFSFGNSDSYLRLSGSHDFFKDKLNIESLDNNKVKVTFEAELEKVGK